MNQPSPGRKVPRTVLFKEEGGSLYALALKHYRQANETLFDLILSANPAITDVRKIGDGQHITLPVITPASYVTELSDGGYRVHIGTFETFDSAVTYSKKIPVTRQAPRNTISRIFFPGHVVPVDPGRLQQQRRGLTVSSAPQRKGSHLYPSEPR